MYLDIMDHLKITKNSVILYLIMLAKYNSAASKKKKTEKI